jgi:2-polyprenyl-6-methoxyphenol hydroxylase-like FAD-dependent oxidoreductase
LNRLGHRVTIFDQYDAPKPIGSGLILQPTGVSVLDWLGLGGRMRRLGATIDRLYGKSAGSARVVLDVRYQALGCLRGLAVHRAGLFHVLHDAVKSAGIEIRTASKVDNLDGNCLILDKGRREGPFDFVVDALGSRSPLIPHASGPDYRSLLSYGALWTSLPWPGKPFEGRSLEQRYHRASIMIGVLPIGKRFEADEQQAAFFWSLKALDYPAWKLAGLENWKTRVQHLWPETEGLLASILHQDQMTMASYDHHTLSLPFGDRLVFIGDSAHSTSPQLGQGANMALLDVMALTEALERHKDLPGAFAAYARARRLHVKLYQALSRVFTPFYQSDSVVLPLARDYLVASLSRLPPMQKLLASIVAGSFGRT